MSTVEQKVALIKEIFAAIDPVTVLEVEDHGDGSMTIIGPFPSFMLLVQPEGPVRALVHVNADAPNMAMLFSVFCTAPGMNIEFDGPYAINGDTGKLLMYQEAYKKKEDNILMFANEIYARRAKESNAVRNAEQGLIVPEEKKIILSV